MILYQDNLQLGPFVTANRYTFILLVIPSRQSIYNVLYDRIAKIS